MSLGDIRLLRGLYDLKYLFGDKWVPAILFALSDGPLRRVEILSTVNSYSIGKEWSDKYATLHDSILARTLKKMTEEGLVTRARSSEDFPPKVFYSLNPDVAELLTLIGPLVRWTEQHPELIAKAQAFRRRIGSETSVLVGDDEFDIDECPEGLRQVPQRKFP